MRYYLFNKDVSNKGNFAIRDHIPKGYPINDANSQRYLPKDSFPDFTPKLSGLLLTHDSSEVDFVSDGGAIGGKGILLSQGAKRLFERFNLGEHAFYPIPFCERRGKRLSSSYFWLQLLIHEPFSLINFQESIFCVKQIFLEQSKDVAITDKESLFQLFGKINIIEEKVSFRQIKLKKEFLDHPPDLFFLWKMSSLPIVSERLVRAMEVKNLTGIAGFIPVDIGF